MGKKNSLSKKLGYVLSSRKTIQIFLAIMIITTVFLGCAPNIEVKSQDNGINRDIRTNLDSDFVGENIQQSNENSNAEADQDSNSINSRNLVHAIDLNYVNQSTSLFLSVGVGSIIDIYEGNSIIMKISIKEIISGKQALISINNERSVEFEQGDFISIRRSYYFQITDINFQNNELSGLAINIFSQNFESYPSILIEEDIGLHNYKYSKRIHTNHSTKYVANYGHANVTIIRGERFASRHIDNRNMIDHKGNRIYKMRSSENVAWVSFIENVEHIIEINGFYTDIIDKYLAKYPSHLTEKTFCEKYVWLEEKDFWTEYFDDTYISVELNEIDLINLEVSLRINELGNITLSTKQFVNLNNSIVLIDQIYINPRERNRVRVCFT